MSKNNIFVLFIGVWGIYGFYQAVQPVLEKSHKWQGAALFLVMLLFVWWALHVVLPGNKKWLSRWQDLRMQYRMVGIALWLTGLFIYIFFFQYTHWGVVFGQPGLRFLLWFWLLEWGALFFTSGENWLDSGAYLKAILLSGAVFVLARAFSTVTDYPFWLGWSEGNRMWDFSLLFGRHLYNYPAHQPIPALIDFGRQLLWGAIFLLPHPTIVQVRFWNALIFVLPLLIFGWVLSRRVSRTALWWLAGIWIFVFLYQGPIYSQLIVSATLVATAWRRRMWLSVPLLIIAGYFAQISRWTWMFAPAIWIVMLEMAGAETDADGRLPRDVWIRAAALGGSGLLGGYVIPFIQKAIAARNAPLAPAEIVSRASRQPLLWYRLLPNPTYPPGILLGLLIAIAAPVLWLIYLRRSGWTLNIWQRLVLWGALSAFGVVGLVASTKIGGGSNLHNLDMFLIALVFVLALAWRSGGEASLLTLDEQPFWVRLVILAMILQPVWQAPLQMRPLRYDKNAVLPFLGADASLPASLPPKDYEQVALKIVNDAIQGADGEILFMDHRQLLTFGYVPAVPLVPEYEKKMMMDEAMSGDAAYFANYYRDLQSGRFALIVSEPLTVHYQIPGEQSFAEENNAWMRWVVEPTLCYYEPVATLERVHVQLLVPGKNGAVCQPYLDAVTHSATP